ncbi:MAG TPA: precorrin-8X methylmutase [Lentisphaeria bacterium]|nr:MAG: precorrin-8X methylmutase [Lentisphaerae bacterium GWF2_49_21]HBC88932.1 precorrin-8X methylmutase [Lentisphaeria bacterium]
MKALSDIKWDMNAAEIEAESFRIIEKEFPNHPFKGPEWNVARRLIHTTADFSICGNLVFKGNPIEAGLKAVTGGAMIYCDSNMIRSGISVPKLRLLNPAYSKESIHCYIADSDVAEMAEKDGTTRALASLKKAEKILDGAIVLIGNAPLALAGIAKLYLEKKIRPSLIIGMPVGFVNVIESKVLLSKTDIPYIMIEGRRGGSTLAVATLHGIMENINHKGTKAQS